MDKSLSFFLDIYNTKTNPDGKTGLNTQKIDGEVSINYFDPADPTVITRNEKKPYSFNAVLSDQAEGQFINYLGNSQTNEFDVTETTVENRSDISLSGIINWTANYPALKLLPKHFAYLKNFASYPANRIIVLRRFNGPAPHNLFKSKAKAISTMVGFYDFENIPVKISFNEKWTQFDGTFLDVIQDVIGIKFDTIPGVGPIFSKASTSGLGQDMLSLIGQKLGIISDGAMPFGDPNLVHDAAIRDVSGEALSTGLESKIEVEFETTYTMNEILGIDAKAAFLDIIANASKMGTSNARFTTGNNSSLQAIFNALKNGDASQLIEAFISGFTEFVNGIKEKLVSGVQAIKNATNGGLNVDAAISAIGEALYGITTTLIANRLSRYKWKLIGSISSLTGSHTAPWHITLGNPKFPWFVCGNMVVEGVEIIPGGELGYNDMFTELTVKIKLRSGRVMGSSEIQTLFNSGSGRIYDTPDKVILLKVPEGSVVNVPNDGSNITVTPPSPNDASNNQIAPEDLNKLDEGTSSSFSLNNTPGNQGQSAI